MLLDRQLKYPRDATWLWKATWLAWYAAHRLFFRYRIEGEANLPEHGGAILASNHNYGIDFVVLAATAPRQVYFMAKAESFRINPLVTMYLNRTGAFPVEREKQDIGALRRAVEILREGKILGMFPEGTRSKDGNLQQGKSGTARIAIAAKAPVVPAVVIGSPEIFKDYANFGRRQEVIVRYGPALTYEGSERGADASQAFTEQIMMAIAELLPRPMRGVYADKVRGAPQFENSSNGGAAKSQ